MATVTPPSKSLTDAAWAAALQMPKFGYSEIATAVKINHDRATVIVRSWEKSGVLVAVEPDLNKRKLWQIAPGAVRPEKPRGRTAEENLWTAMRGLGAFTPSVLAANATVDPLSVSTEEAQAYCRSLLAVGYLRVMRKAAPPLVEAIYRLVKNTGPKPPLERRLRAIVDDNTDAVHLIRGAGQ